MTRSVWLIAGPNGSGKSTLAREPSFRSLLATPEDDEPVVEINPDQIRRALANLGRDLPHLARKAAEQADARFAEAIEAGRSVLRETVLSEDRLLPLIKHAKSKGFRVGLFFVFLRSPDLNVARVAQRVAQGGHDVPEDKIRARWSRSLAMAARFAREADIVIVQDNSQLGASELVIEATPSKLYVAPKPWACLVDNAKYGLEIETALDAIVSALEH